MSDFAPPAIPSKIYDDPPESEDNVETAMPRLAYIHLKEARIFMSGQKAIPIEGLLWRGRLSEIGGFSLGQMSVS